MEKKKIIKNIIRIAVVAVIIFAVHKFTQDDIKIKSRKPSVIVYDDDAMDAKRLKVLTGEFYTTTSPDKELCLFDIDENADYGTSFVKDVKNYEEIELSYKRY